jgi:hypothetical protein
MKGMNWERYAGATGIVFVVLWVVAALVMGSPASYDDSGSSIVSWLQDNRREILIATILQGAAAVAYFWYLAALAARVREGGEARLGATLFGAGIVVAGVSTVCSLITAGLAYGIEQNTDAAIVKALYDLALVGSPMIGWAAAALALATGIATLRSGIFAAWFGWLSVAGAAWFVLGGLAFARDGFLAVDGAASMIGLIVFLAWVLVGSGLLTQQAGAAEPAQRSAMAPM